MTAVAVIGAGVGGLAAAARLAAAGHTVTVYERADSVGGKLGRYTRRTAAGDFTFDTGPSLFTLPQVFEDLFAETGAKLTDHLDLVPLDPIVRHHFPDGATLDSCQDPREFRNRIDAAFGPRAAEDWRRLWIRAERVWNASWRDVLRRPLDGPADLARLAWHVRDLAAIAPGRTLRDLGRGYLHDANMRMLLDRYATYAGADPRRAPAALVAVPYAELAFGGWYVRGGLGRLGDALLSHCLDLGVVVETGATVTRIEAVGGQVQAIRVRGTRGVSHRVPVRTVVANVDALTLYRDLLPSPRRLAALTDRSLAGFVLLLGVRGDSGMAHHSVFFPRDYDAEFDAVFGDPGRGVPARPAKDPTVFVTVADDPAARPDGHEAWFVLVNAPRHGTAAGAVDWRRPGLADAYADRILDLLAERGMDVRDRLLFREVRTPADLQVSAQAPGGAIYGTANHTLLRPANRGPVHGLHLVGGSAHPGGGLPMVALSAEIAASQIIRG
ncbi:phytoene desaturase family protein [Catenuloplanes sp. NPDC051500]|uniref:phytoene desaturase family protein n=1 Tax=Catenuloplanes sp. NPDC051500 TaxID=3363959 RepID=UPI0037A9339A